MSFTKPVATDVRAQLLAHESKLRKRLGDDIALNIRIAPDLWHAAVEPAHFSQALDAFTQDAHQALEGYGDVTIRLQNALIQSPKTPLQAGQYVKLSLLDSRASLPEPLASPPLGVLEAEPLPEGCARHAYWPRAYPPPPLTKPPKPQTPKTPKTLLLVEDDDLVRFALLRGLRAYGYQVFAAETAEEALALSTPDAIDLLVTDLVMPGLNGFDLAERLLAQNRISRVLFVSGYPSETIHHHGPLRGDVAYLQKPFTPSELEVKIRAILDAPDPQKPL